MMKAGRIVFLALLAFLLLAVLSVANAMTPKRGANGGVRRARAESSDQQADGLLTALLGRPYELQQDEFMPTITIRVLRDGEAVSGHRVAIDYGTFGGISSPQHTDSDGTAEFEAEYGQGGDVFVDGDNVGTWGSYSGTDVTVDLG